MSSINNAGQQPRLCIDLNVAYRAEDDNALNDDRVDGSGTPHAATQPATEEGGRNTSQIRVISDSVQVSYNMRHSVPQAQTSLRAPRGQTINAGKIVVSIENANQRISMTSSFPSMCILPRETGSSSSLFATEQRATTLSFALSHNAGQSGETPEEGISKVTPLNKNKYPVPEALKRPGDTDETRISKSALSMRQLVLIPEALRFPGETDQTLVSRNTLSMRQFVPVPAMLRLAGETDQTLIRRNALLKRQLVPVPTALRLEGETDQTRITKSSLYRRKRLVPVPEALRESGETEGTKIFKQILQNRKRQRSDEQISAGIKKSKQTE